MSASGFLGTRILCPFLFATSSSRTSTTSFFCSSARSHTLLHLVRPYASKTVIESNEEIPFTVSYLKNSCGLSSELAKHVSKHVNFESPERPDLVISLLKAQGFTNAQISKVIRWQPYLLKANPMTRFLPKVEFFRSLGCSNADIVAIFSRNPGLLLLSLEKRIVPCYDIIKSVLHSDSKVVKSFQCHLSHWSLVPETLALNIQEMRNHGVCPSSISFLLTTYLAVLFRRPSKFREILNEVEQMGFDPLKCYFVTAIQVLSSMSKLTLESKINVLERFGLSRDEAWAVFKKQPFCMHFSKEKITKVMDFLLNQMRWESHDIVMSPQVFLYSLEKRTIPRCSVAHVLRSKGLEKEIKLSTLLVVPEEMFVKKYVASYQGTMPQLLDLYKGKVSLADL